MSTSQLNFDIPVALKPDAYNFGERSSGESHGVVLTKPHVVTLILDLAGYQSDKDLASFSFLEPACGHGAFLVEAISRLIESARKFSKPVKSLANAISAYDIDPDHIAISRQAVKKLLENDGLSSEEAGELSNQWIRHADFLLEQQSRTFDFVVGNPPYIRIEQISPTLQAEYRRKYNSLYDRADIYVAFIERGLDLLSPSGILAYICADRWILNKYGSPLRRMLTDSFNVRYYVDLHRASPFDSDVIAYPSIFVLDRQKATQVRVASLESASREECESLVTSLRGELTQLSAVRIEEYSSWFKGDEPWVISTPVHLQVLRDLESKFMPLESYDTRVGIGVATGNDKIFIVDDSADIESDRLVPLVMRDDLENGEIRNSNRNVINVFQDGGGVVDLDDYPRLAAYLREHESIIRKRHVAQKNTRGWFRTIDRVYPTLVKTPKLLIPDIAGSNQVVLDAGNFHPHHNLYFVTSTLWDMKILGGLLSSKVALYFVWSYAVRMRGGYLRFQAQYLRRIRTPNPRSISSDLGKRISDAFTQRDFSALDQFALEAYGIESLPHFDFVDNRA